MVDQDGLGPRDLEDPALRVIPKKYLNVVVRILRILGRKIPARLENDKPTVTTNAAGKRFCSGIGELSDEGIHLPPNGEANSKQSYNC